jgi:hypothetical protein
VVFAPGAPPLPPSAIDVDNLGSAARAVRRAQRDDHLGFEIAWDPPGIADPAVLALWPADAQSAPPTEVAGYVLERSRRRRSVRRPAGLGRPPLPGRATPTR